MSTKGAVLQLAKTQLFAFTVPGTAGDSKLNSQEHTKIPCVHERYDSLYIEELWCITATTDKRLQDDYLWSHVIQSASSCNRPLTCCVYRQTKVSQLDAFVRHQQNVLRLDVPMNYALQI